MQVHIARPTVVARIALTDTVRKGAATGLDEILRSRTVPVVGIIVVPGHTSAPAYLTAIPFPLVLIAGVECSSLGLSLTLIVTSSTSATPREVSVVHVVSIGHECIAHVTERFHCRQTQTVAMFGPIAQIRIGLYTFAGTTLGHEFEREIIISVIDTRHTR